MQADRPNGERVLGMGAGCVNTARQDDGLLAEWLEAGRDDRLILNSGCAAERSAMVERLRQATAALGLRGLAWPQ